MAMRRLLLLSFLLCLVISNQQVMLAQGSQVVANPLYYLQRYFNMINSGQYANALQLTSETNFYPYVESYHNIERIIPYFGNVQNIDDDLRIPTVLVNYQHDQSIQVFFGCIFMQTTNEGYGIRISDDSLQLMDFTTEPSIASVSHAITHLDCYHNPTVYPNAAPSELGEASMIIHQYFRAIEMRAYDLAHHVWLTPLPNPLSDRAPATDYRPTYDDFITGYQNTHHITVYTGGLGEYQSGAPAQPYVNGYVPVVLVSQEFDTLTTHSGCYAMGRHLDNHLGIINGKLSLLTEGVPTADQIYQALITDCTTLNISQ